MLLGRRKHPYKSSRMSSHRSPGVALVWRPNQFASRVRLSLTSDDVCYIIPGEVPKRVAGTATRPTRSLLAP